MESFPDYGNVLIVKVLALVFRAGHRQVENGKWQSENEHEDEHADEGDGKAMQPVSGRGLGPGKPKVAPKAFGATLG